MPLFITVIISKVILALLRLTGRGGGSALPGLVAERIDPNIAAKLVKRLPEGVIVVTGTNGKTTTTKMLAEVLAGSGKRVVTNRSGSNLTRGVVSSLIEQASLTGRLDFDLGLFEVDEATMTAVCRLLKPRAIVVLNLFRDQLDRYGELDTTARLIGNAINTTSAKVYLNADDPLVASLAKYCLDQEQVRYFGVENSPAKRLSSDHAADSDHCPVCGRALDYKQSFFGHIGHYSCPNGDFERPVPQYALNQGKDELYEVKLPQGLVKLDLQLPGLYNAYNALAALVVASELGIDVDKIAVSLSRVSAAFGRVERVELEGRQVYLLLIKNPTGFNQIIQTFLLDGRAQNILIAINDNFADGRDVSWLWDVAIEELGPQLSQKPKVKGQRSIIVSGVRAADMALRLKYADIQAEIEPDLAVAIKQLVKATPEGETAYILPTYTAMLKIRELITKEAKLEGFWK